MHVVLSLRHLHCSLGYEYGVNLQHEHTENSPNEEMIVTIPEKINGNTVGELNSTFYASGAVKISLPYSIRYIGDDTFRECMYLKKVELSEGIIYIGKNVFRDCQSLESIEIPLGVEVIPANMFLSCYSLKEVILPESVKYIESGAFAACRSLESLKLPESLLYIGSGAFANCDSLWELQVPEKTLAAEDAFTLYESVGDELVPVRKVTDTK